MRISDWSSDVCSSDLHLPLAFLAEGEVRPDVRRREQDAGAAAEGFEAEGPALPHALDAVVTGRDDMRVNVDEEGHVPHRTRSAQKPMGKEGCSNGSARWSPTT